MYIKKTTDGISIMHYPIASFGGIVDERCCNL